MIELLRLQNIAVVEAEELEFGPGLNVLTGETGAGKSVILSALTLLTGGRASPDMIRTGAAEAVVEAIFSVRESPVLQEALRAQELSFDEEGVVVRRTLTRNGRSRAQVGGQLVPVATLWELFSSQIEISSQHASQSLLSSETQGLLLDVRGELLALRRKLEEEVAQWRRCQARSTTLREQCEERARRKDFLEFQVREIDEAKVRPGEREALTSERGRLVHAERLRDEVGRAAMLLTGGDDTGEIPAVLDLLSRAERAVDGLTSVDAALEPLATRLREASVELQDLTYDLERYASEIDSDPARLEEMEQRLEELSRLGRKYGATEEEILSFRDRAAEELLVLEGTDEELESLRRQQLVIEEELRCDSHALSERRSRVGKLLEREVEESLQHLAMPNASFRVVLEPVEPSIGNICGASGLERPEFRFSANPGEELRPLRKVVSGGELSRLFLTIKNALRSTDSGMLLVFDEVDTGIGGGVAERVGRLLAQLALEHQVICITHLPQIASLGEVHFAISKASSGGRTQAKVSLLDGESRVEEIARMAGGETVSEATRKHARALLKAARAD